MSLYERGGIVMARMNVTEQEFRKSLNSFMKRIKNKRTLDMLYTRFVKYKSNEARKKSLVIPGFTRRKRRELIEHCKRQTEWLRPLSSGYVEHLIFLQLLERATGDMIDDNFKIENYEQEYFIQG